VVDFRLDCAGCGVLNACPDYARSELGRFARVVVQRAGNTGVATEHGQGQRAFARRRACWLHVPATRESDGQSRTASVRWQSVARWRAHSTRTGGTSVTFCQFVMGTCLFISYLSITVVMVNHNRKLASTLTMMYKHFGPRDTSDPRGLGHFRYMTVSVQRGGQFRYMTTSVHMTSISVHAKYRFGTSLSRYQYIASCLFMLKVCKC